MIEKHVYEMNNRFHIKKNVIRTLKINACLFPAVIWSSSCSIGCISLHNRVVILRVICGPIGTIDSLLVIVQLQTFYYRVHVFNRN